MRSTQLPVPTKYCIARVTLNTTFQRPTPVRSHTTGMSWLGTSCRGGAIGYMGDARRRFLRSASAVLLWDVPTSKYFGSDVHVEESLSEVLGFGRFLDGIITHARHSGGYGIEAKRDTWRMT